MKRSHLVNPLHKPSDWETIKQWRNVHKVSPVQTSVGLFDAGRTAEDDITQAIDTFDHLPTLQDGKLQWKTAHNTYALFTKQELIDMYEELKINRAVRAAVLHYRGEIFRFMVTPPTPDELSDIDFWLSFS